MTVHRPVQTHGPNSSSGVRDLFAREGVYLEGDFFLLGNAHIHFGHFLLEGLSRLWALDVAEQYFGHDFKILVYEDRLRKFSEELLFFSGIPRARIISCPPVARCERLIAPDVAMRTHSWITPLQGVTWSRFRERFALSSAGFAAETANSVYLSRSRVGGRKLTNEHEIENLHRKYGYEIVYPETLSVSEQLSVVLNAASLSGCVGSQMYLAAFQRPGGRNLIVAPENFFLKDDMLIASACGHEVNAVFGSIISATDDQTWTCDVSDVERALKEIVI